MVRTYNPKAIANWFLDRARRDATTLCPMRIQTLVYLAHGWHLGLRSEPLIDEEVQAWAYGPVVTSLYHEFKEFGAEEITRQASSAKMDPGGAWKAVRPNVPASDTDTVALLERVWEGYGRFSATQLSSMTHRPGTPWSVARDRMESGLRTTVIRNAVLRKGFAELAARNRSSEN